MKINKRFLQCIAALQILIFHLWMPITKTTIEQFLIKTGYIGVDLFFFLSAYSLADKTISYGSFLKNRVLVLYAKFAFFVGLMAISNTSFGIHRIWKSLTFFEFFERGGGAFLWFLPAILLFYFLYPFFLRWGNRWKVLLVLFLWMVGSIVLEKGFSYTAIFIFTNRIPIILAGYVLKKKSIPPWVVVLFFPIGIAFIYFFGFYRKLHFPIRDMYYVFVVPMVIALVILSSYIKKNRIWDVLSSVTLELYALQMIFGQKIVCGLYFEIKNPLLTNIGVLLVFFTLAFLLKGVFVKIEAFCKKVKN